MRTSLPNFRGRSALVLNRSDSNSETLVRKLENLGLAVDVCWPAERVSAKGYDVIFFDADLGYDGLFSWPPDLPPVPMVAMMGSEAPGRIEWAISRTPSAYLTKPIGSTGVFSALAIAFHTFNTQRKLKTAIADLHRRAKARPVVIKAILAVMNQHGVSDTAAYQLLRTESMKQRMSIENLCAQIANSDAAAMNRMPVNSKGRLRRENRR
jgi:two-component system, response regulator / RNA-binding antiterminator